MIVQNGRGHSPMQGDTLVEASRRYSATAPLTCHRFWTGRIGLAGQGIVVLAGVFPFPRIARRRPGRQAPAGAG
jgi:hypothetical protein